MLTLPLLSFLCQSLAGLHEIIKTVMDDHFSLFSRCFQRRSRVSMPPPSHPHPHRPHAAAAAAAAHTTPRPLRRLPQRKTVMPGPEDSTDELEDSMARSDAKLALSVDDVRALATQLGLPPLLVRREFNKAVERKMNQRSSAHRHSRK